MISEEFYGFVQYLSHVSGLPQPVLVVMAFVAGIGWICWRTRSSHIVLTRIWRIAFGPAMQTDDEIAQFIEERNRLVTFRFHSGLPVRTLTQAKRLIQWSRDNDEEVGTIRACGELFDLEACYPRSERVPKPWQQLVVGAITLAFLIAAVSAGIGAWTDRAMLQFKESKTWFFLSNESAVSFSGNARLTRKQCADLSIDNHVPMPPFSPEEVLALCKAFDSSDIGDDVRRYVSQQRFGFGLLGVLLALGTWSCGLVFFRNECAMGLKRRLDRRGATRAVASD